MGELHCNRYVVLFFWGKGGDFVIVVVIVEWIFF